MDMGSLDLASLFALGLLGTVHCLGMCGPLVMALPGQTGRVQAHLLYHLGRITTYTGMGALLGGVGPGLEAIGASGGFDILSITAHIQVALSVLAGLLLLLLGMTRLGILGEPRWLKAISLSRFPGFAIHINRFARSPGPAQMWFAGLMMGLLPCGLTFAALSRALASGGPLQGGGGLLAFGIGTLPGLLLLGAGVSVYFRRYRQLAEVLSGVLMIGMALSLFVATLQAPVAQ